MKTKYTLIALAFAITLSQLPAFAADEADIQKAIDYVKKHEKDGSFKPSGNGWVSADGERSFNLTGLVHFDSRNIDNGLSESNDKDSASGASNYEVRRARLGFNGSIAKDLDYEILTNLVGSNANLIHRAYINYGFNKNAQFRVGRFKQPFSLEEMTSANAVDFQERSYGNQLVASQRLGAMVFGEPKKGFTYALSSYQDGFNVPPQPQPLSTHVLRFCLSGLRTEVWQMPTEHKLLVT